MADVLDVAEALVVRPGDRLIIRISPDRIRSKQHMDEFSAEVKRLLPDAIVVAADQLAVEQRPGD